MTISAQTTNRTSTTGNGVTTSFSFPYPFTAQADLVVLLVLVASPYTQTTQVLNSGYTISGTADAQGRYGSGANVVFSSAPSALYNVVIYADPSVAQGLDLVENDPLPVEQVELGLDKLTLMVRRLADRIARSLRFSDSEVSTSSLIIPTPAANSIFGWNAAGTALINYVVQVGTSLVDLAASAGASLIGFIQSGTGLGATTTAAQLQKSEFFESISALKAWSGPTNKTLAFVRGYYAAGDGGGGIYYYDSASSATDNGGTIIRPTAAPATGRWLRQYDALQYGLKVFGAKGDGTTDDTTPIQAAINAAGSAGQVQLQPGNYAVTSSLTFTASQNISFAAIAGSGSSTAPVQFTWNGANSGTVFLLDRVRDSYFSGFGIVAGTGTIGIGIRIDHVSAPSGGTLSSHNIFSRLSIGTSTTAIQIGNSSAANNDLHVFEDCNINGTGTNGIVINNSQSKFIDIRGGSVVGRTNGISVTAGSFVCHGTNFSGNAVDVLLGSPTDIILIEGAQSEGAGRFLDAATNTASAWAVTVQGCRLDPASANADNKYIRYHKKGPLNLIGNDFTSGSYYASVIFEITDGGYSAGGYKEPMANVIGNVFPNRTPIPQTDRHAIHFVGNLGMNASANPQPMNIDGAGTPADTTATGVSVFQSGQLRRSMTKVMVEYTALAAAATTADLTIYTLNKRERLVGIVADTTTAYHGGATTAGTLIVGKTVGGNEYIVSHDVWTAAVTKGNADADLGTSINRANAVQGGDMPSWSATTAISVRLTTTTANTNALTQGRTAFYIITESHPLTAGL